MDGEEDRPDIAKESSFVAPAAWRRPALDWRTFFGTPTAELLARLHDGDPLALRALAADRRDEHAYLISTHRLFLRSVARAAFEGGRYRGEPPLAKWKIRTGGPVGEGARGGGPAGRPARQSR